MLGSIFHNLGMSSVNTTTLYIDVADMRSLVTKVGLKAIIRETVEELRGNYSRWHDFEKSPRTANHSEVGVIELMPVSDDARFGFKYVNGHPKNPLQGLSTVMAFGALSVVETGFPILISEMTILTAIRTAATSVLAAQVMARNDSKSMAMIGNGAQSEFQILAFHDLLGIETFKIYDVDPKATEKLMRNLAGIPGLTLIPCGSTPEACEGVDIITTCTADKTNATIVTINEVKPGMHVNGIGGDCPGKTEVGASVLEKARVVVEYAPQTRIEGDIQQMPADFPVTELFEILTGKATGRASDEEITVFDSVGFALEDFSALCVVHKLAMEHGIGTTLNLIPEMADVKDLFGQVSVAGAVSR